jgi:cobalt-zinc-cadmium efflux system outer membrane protein
MRGHIWFIFFRIAVITGFVKTLSQSARHQYGKAFVLFALIIFFAADSRAGGGTDTLRLTLSQCEKMFIDSNYQLLAQKYNVEATRALIIQAKVFPNPNASYSQTLYNTNAKRWFPAPGSDIGEEVVGFSQLIQIAGKRNNSIKLAKANTTLSEYQFFDLVRTLKYTLRSDFFNIYYLLQSAQVYDTEIKALQKIADAYDAQKAKAYISEKDVVRIKAQLYSLRSEYNDLRNQINDAESEIRQITEIKRKFIIPIVDTVKLKDLDPHKYPLAALIDSAYQNRTDLLIAKETTEINKINLKYQRSLGVPDPSLNFSYDQQGSYIHNLTMIGVSIDLPFFNRNQGNIKSARYNIKSSMAAQEGVALTLEENVYRSLQKALDDEVLIKNIDPAFSGDFDRLAGEVVRNYQVRNISLLDFLDFYDSYKQNYIQVNTIYYNRVQSFEDLNYYTATNFFNQ